MKIPGSLKYDTLENAIDILSRAFMRDVFQGYFNRTHFGLRRSFPISVEHNRTIFSHMLPNLRNDGAFFLTTPSTPFVTTVWHVDRVPEDNIPLESDPETPAALHEIFSTSMRTLQNVLPRGSQALHYVLAGNLKSKAGENTKQRGLSFINKEMFAAASAARLPIYAECTNTNSRDMCLYYGFEQLNEMRLGSGTTNEKGEVEEGGQGLLIYLVMKRP